MSSNQTIPLQEARRFNQPQEYPFIAQFGILLALEAVVLHPLGSLPAIGPVVATLSHIPVIITAVVLGTKAGALRDSFRAVQLIADVYPPNPAIAFVFTRLFGRRGGQLS